MTYKLKPRFKEPVGLGTLKDYLDMAWHCVNCNYCQHMWSWDVKSSDFIDICPSFAKNKLFSYSARGRSQIIRALLDGDFDYEDSNKILDIAYQCMLCGACDINCLRLHERTPGQMIEVLRADLIENGYILPEHQAFLESTLKRGNPFSAPQKERVRWVKNLDFEIKDLSRGGDKCEVLLYVGCMYSLEPRVWDETKRFAQIMKQSGVSFGYLGDSEKCCGIEQLRIGEQGLFEMIAEENIELFNNLGVSTLVVPCPHCYLSFRKYYPQVGKLNMEILHFTEYVKRLLDGKKLTIKRAKNQVVTYNDPCNLGRWAGIYDEPREILLGIEGTELHEMERNHDQAWCCGAGGGVMAAYPDLALWSAGERIKEAAATGAESIVTSCPWCKYNLKNANEIEKSNLVVQDIVELIWQSIRD